MTLLHDLRLLMFAVTLKEIGKWSDEQTLESSRTFRSFTVCVGNLLGLHQGCYLFYAWVSLCTASAQGH